MSAIYYIMIYGIKKKGENCMSKGKGVSVKTHTTQQLNDYANQNNPNNKAYRAREANNCEMKKK